MQKLHAFLSKRAIKKRLYIGVYSYFFHVLHDILLIFKFKNKKYTYV